MTRIELIKGDITKLKVDAIVNAANVHLKGGGGVDGSIHKAAGQILHQQCMNIIEKMGGLLPVGEAAITQGGNLPAKFVIHTVGPIWRDGNYDENVYLKNAYNNTLKLAVDFGIKSIAFPNISTGIYRFPKREAAHIAIEVVKMFLEDNQTIEKVIFCCYEDENFKIYKEILNL